MNRGGEFGANKFIFGVAAHVQWAFSFEIRLLFFLKQVQTLGVAFLKLPGLLDCWHEINETRNASFFGHRLPTRAAFKEICPWRVER